MGGRGVGGSWVDVGVGRDGSDVLRQIANCTLLLDESIAVNRSQLKAFKGKHQMNLCCDLERQSWVQLRILCCLHLQNGFKPRFNANSMPLYLEIESQYARILS